LLWASPSMSGYGPGTAFVLLATGGLLATTLPTAWWMWHEPDPAA